MENQSPNSGGSTNSVTGKRKRARVRHSRNGCITCKIRRVKCDETHPTCAKCGISGWKCDGYATATPPYRSTSSRSPPSISSNNTRPLVIAARSRPAIKPPPPQTSVTRPLAIAPLPPPPPAVNQSTPPPSFSPASILALTTNPITPPLSIGLDKFVSSQEHTYFTTFCTQTSAQLSGVIEDGLWCRLVLQACETELPIRYTVFAVGALTCPSPREREKDKNPESAHKRGETKHRTFASDAYQKAVSHLRLSSPSLSTSSQSSVLSDKKDGERRGERKEKDLRAHLFSTLVLLNFALLTNSTSSISSLPHAGVKMIQEFFLLSRHSPSGSPLTSTSHQISNRLVGEDELIHAFRELEMHSLTYTSTRPKSLDTHQKSRDLEFDNMSIDSMPREFSTLQDARAYLDLIARRGLQWVASLEQDPGRRKESNPLNLGPFPPSHVPWEGDEETIAGWRLVLAEFEKWDLSFQPLWNLARTESGQDIRLAATGLKLHHLSAYLSKITLCGGRSVYYGRYDCECEQIVTWAQYILSQSQLQTPSFFASYQNFGKESKEELNYDIQVITPLALTTHTFRNRLLRRQALTLLYTSNRKEGIWDPSIMCKALQWLCEIEEKGLGPPEESGVIYVPENRVVRNVEMVQDKERRETRVSCEQPLRYGSQETVRRSCVIPWDAV